MGSMIADSKLLLDHLNDPRRGPDITPEAKGHRAFGQQVGQQCHLFGTQLRLSAWRGLMPQGLHSLRLRFFERTL